MCEDDNAEELELQKWSLFKQIALSWRVQTKQQIDQHKHQSVNAVAQLVNVISAPLTDWKHSEFPVAHWR